MDLNTIQSTTSISKEALLKNMKKKAYEVKFDLEGTNYLPIENIGIGAYGVVCSAVHNKSKDRVAIKKIPDIFDDRRVATRTYREIKILKHFKHDNIIAIRDILKPKETLDKFRDVYVVFDLMESDLHRIIYSKQELSEEHVRYFLYQLLRGLKYIHSANVIHRDLKPSNLLVNEDCQLRIGDFGMARGVNIAGPEENNHFLTQYVATRWYRAPEIMMALLEYGTAVDMWSVGCIFAEMLGRKHLFPGKDFIHQIKLIVGVLGSPSPELLKLCQSDIIKKFILKLGNKAAICWKDLFPHASKKAIDLLSKMLVLHPGNRISVDYCLKTSEMSKEALRDLIFKEIMEYHEPRTPTLSFSAFLKPVPKPANNTSPIVSTTQPSIMLVKPSENVTTNLTEPFKQPILISEAEKSLAVFTKNLQSTTSDIEMLSAKQQSENKSLTDAGRGKVDEKKSESKKNDGKHETTISSDTKALVKAALLNPNLKKQRSESTSDADDKNKPVTAAQRQREREEKRRLKKEKALERMKKNKDKKEQKPEQLLTDADRELLQRWSKMQKANQPIAPKPETKSTQGTNFNVANQQPGIQTSQNAFPNQQNFIQQQIGVGNFGGHIGQSQSSSYVNSTSNQQGKSLIKVDTMHMLQQKLQARSMQNSQPSQQNDAANSNMFANAQQSDQNNTLAQKVQTVTINHSNDNSKEQLVQNVSSQGVSDLPTINVDSLKMLGMTGSQTQAEQNTLQNSNSNSEYLSLHQNDATNEVHFCDQQQEFPTNSQAFRDFQSQSSPLSNQGSPQKEYSNHGSPESYQSAASPEYCGSNHTPDTTPPRRSSNESSNPFPSQLQSNQQYGTPQSTVVNTGTYFHQISTESSTSVSSPPEFPQFGKDLQMPYVPVLQSTDQMYTPTIQEYQSSDIPFSNQEQVQSSRSLPTRVTLPPPLSLGRRETSPQAGPSNPNNPFTVNVRQDLISMLSKQLSKSQVEDPGPPALTLTPRGTGAGYGVGMDLDTLMIDAQDTDSIRPEPSPLSSSLLTDWMEVTGDLNIDMDALEQELSLQSPMSFSYNDLSLYHN
ncbi:hypothetical protein FSP39_018160 [Pinctada imbricata]|uniref:Mitogen-activated protein kinase n=1 Tax=Pinctada imbricata TaxID=66713 RepID=A0AA88XP05_PINIB|nr:hypothetical protein FSP39_018160 [Pinctada imbricata]